jgi:hypothetical protein
MSDFCMSQIDSFKILRNLSSKDEVNSICTIKGAIHAPMHLIDGDIDPHDCIPDVQVASGSMESLLAQVHVIVGSEHG